MGGENVWEPGNVFIIDGAYESGKIREILLHL